MYATFDPHGQTLDKPALNIIQFVTIRVIGIQSDSETKNNEKKAKPFSLCEFPVALCFSSVRLEAETQPVT